jgi:hypothetical protein
MLVAPGVATPLEGIIFGEDVGCSGAAPEETPGPGLPDWMMATRDAVFPLWGIILEQSLASGGSEVEQRVPSLVDDGGSWWHGVAKAQ